MNLTDIHRDFPILYNDMLMAGMIINDSLDEFDLLKKTIYNSDNNSDSYIVHVNPTLDCNFNCWYCYENHIPQSKMSANVLHATNKFISSVILNPLVKNVDIGFFGGEPLYYFDKIAKNIIEKANNLCASNGKYLHIQFTSNGFLLTNDIILFLSKIPCGFQITLDGDEKCHNEIRYNKNRKGSYKVIVDNIIKLVNAQIDVIIRVNYTNSNIDSIDSILDSFRNLTRDEKKFVKFDFQRVWQDRIDMQDETENKIKQIRKLFRNEGFVVLANYIPHHSKDSCYGDKINHLLINFNGDVYGCTARDFNHENRLGYLNEDGTIYYDSEKLKLRNNSKLSKNICATCRIAPLCGGGCKQRAYETLNIDECTFGYSEDEKDRIILNIFEHSFINNTLE